MQPVFLVSFPKLEDFSRYADFRSSGSRIAADRILEAHSLYEKGLLETQKMLLGAGLAVRTVVFDRGAFYAWARNRKTNPDESAVPLWVHDTMLVSDQILGETKRYSA